MTLATNDEIRTRVHGMWSAVAPPWAEHADDVDERGLDVTRAMLTSADPRRGDRVLELACGPGGAGMAAAARVGPSGEVVLSDVAPEMVAIAAERAARRGLGNVRTATLDLETIDEADHSYDVVLCREGLMFAVEPDRALREMHRVLRPGGRLAVAVWGPRQENPWLDVLFDAVTTVTGFPVPPPGMPGPFALSDEANLRELFVAAGFADVVIERRPTPLRSPSFDAWWSRTAALAGPIAAMLSRLDADTAAAIENQLRIAVAPYTRASGLDLPGLCLVASGHKEISGNCRKD
jgi:ubiquinone/menaquinone biosynthesis C-methylase UbiE